MGVPWCAYAKCIHCSQGNQAAEFIWRRQYLCELFRQLSGRAYATLLKSLLCLGIVVSPRLFEFAAFPVLTAGKPSLATAARNRSLQPIAAPWRRVPSVRTRTSRSDPGSATDGRPGARRAGSSGRAPENLGARARRKPPVCRTTPRDRPAIGCWPGRVRPRCRGWRGAAVRVKRPRPIPVGDQHVADLGWTRGMLIAGTKERGATYVAPLFS